jgi:pimeloyl-ACP methyl ester carboxylesterase
MTIPYTVLPALALTLATSAAAQNVMTGSSSPPPPPFNPCGSGVLTITIGGSPSGEERYEVQCAPDGSMKATGSSKIALGGMTADYVITMELDSGAIPRLVSAKGTSSTGPLDDTLILRGAQTQFTRAGKTQTVPAAEGAAYVGNNLFWPMVFLMARYDQAKGGSQSIPVFPSLTATITYERADTVMPSGAAAGPPRTYYRYRLAVGPAPVTVWSDDAGRMAAIGVGVARLLVTDTRHAAYAPELAQAAGIRHAIVPPDYSAPPDAPFTAEEVTVEANGFTLAGTLLIPKGGKPPYPAAITITGSGQQTRDQAIPIPGLERYAPFRQIAEELASNGIAVLRVDDRGVGGSTGGETLASATSESFADDVRAQLRFLRARADIDGDRIALIGHSEGAIIAPMVAATDSTVAALVLIAGTATRGDTVLREQLEAFLEADDTRTVADKEKARAEHRETLRKIRAGEHVPGVGGAEWLRFFMEYDPLVPLRKVHQPVLIIHGENDRQVLVHHARDVANALKAAGNDQVELKIFPGLNHLLLPSEHGSVNEYGTLEVQSLGDDLLGVISGWLTRALRVE